MVSPESHQDRAILLARLGTVQFCFVERSSKMLKNYI
uniref:Uncharacterized protein n=1 Tax=Anguilla anguilla TaxID=7936 RepID=A0A0E9QFL8_ANGAN